jgi:hypothetical protein
VAAAMPIYFFVVRVFCGFLDRECAQIADANRVNKGGFWFALSGRGPFCPGFPWALPTANMELRFQREDFSTVRLV